MKNILTTFKNYLLLKNYQNSIDNGDLIEQQKFKLFRILTLSLFTIYLSFNIMYDKVSWNNIYLFYINQSLFIIAFLNYLLLNYHIKSKFSYVVRIIIIIILVHIFNYKTGGIKNSGNAYFFAIILISFMLVGKRMGIIATIIIVFNLFYFYFINQYTNLTDFRLSKNQDYLRVLDYFITFLITTIIVYSLSSYIQNTNNKIVENIKSSSQKLLDTEKEKEQL